MAPAPEARKKGLDWSHPGGREALIGGGVALALALLYFYIKNRNTSKAAPATGQGTNFIVSPTGMFTSWIHDHQGSTTTTVVVPNVVGQRAEVAGPIIKGVGLVPKLSVGTPKGRTGTITAENPSAGTKVAAGSVVNLTNKISGGPDKDEGQSGEA